MQMNKRDMLRCATSILFAAFTAASAMAQSLDASCARLEREEGGGSSFYQVWVFAKHIKAPGKYCLSGDIKAPRVFAWSEGGEKGSDDALLRVKAGHVDIDLQGFALQAMTRDLSGIVSNGPDGERALIQSVHIHGGTVVSRTGYAIRLDDLFSGDYGSLKSVSTSASGQLRQFIEEARARFAATVSRYQADFPVSGHRLEDLKLQSAEPAIAIKGAGNVIRNSVIEVDGCNAIALVGPNQVIENNRIVVKNAREGCAAITLIAGHGSVIHRNRIVSKSHSEAGILLLGSMDVKVEGNHFEGVDKSVEASADPLWGKSTMMEQKSSIGR